MIFSIPIIIKPKIFLLDSNKRSLLKLKLLLLKRVTGKKRQEKDNNPEMDYNSGSCTVIINVCFFS
jgi:hypothetical protein